MLTVRHMRRLPFSALCLLALAPLSAEAARTKARPLSSDAVRTAVASYAEARGIRVSALAAHVEGLSGSGKSTRASVMVGRSPVQVAVNHETGRVQSGETGRLVGALLRAHQPHERAEVREGSSYAMDIKAFFGPNGVTRPMLRTNLRKAPLGRPRAGQSKAMEALDALPLDGGTVVVELGQHITTGRRGAALVVRENGLGAGADIVNQTPGLVEAMVDGNWYRIGFAGYKTAGDKLLLANAMDPLPAGRPIVYVRVTDAPAAPHIADPTDNATAAARGVKGFDLVSVQGVRGGK